MTDEPFHDLKRNVWWIRDAANPVLPPGEPGSFDSTCCMNPFVVRRGDRYSLYYAGGDDEGRRRICLATAPAGDVRSWRREGPVLDVGPAGDFDEYWCVLPHVVRVAPNRWHLYYTGRRRTGEGLASFGGIGLAVSEDGRTWRRHEANPILRPTGVAGDPDAIGIAGGSVLRVRRPGGAFEWRFYYTGAPTLGDDLFLDQQKTVCLAVSQDGITWRRRGAVMRRDPEREYEDVAVAGPVVRQEADGSFRMWFSAIGTRWGAYAICYAESDDGIRWRRGAHVGDDLQLTPAGDGWERRMVEYPAVVREGRRLRLFYCGNGYGASGIGTAVASPLRATARVGPSLVRIVAAEADAGWSYRIPEGLSCDEGVFKTHHHPIVDWRGPDARGTLWHEWETNDKDFEILRSSGLGETLGLVFIRGIHYRVQITPSQDGLDLRFTATNIGARPLHNVVAFPCLGHPTTNFEDNALERTWIVTEAGLTPIQDTHRGTGDPRRTHYPVAGAPPMRFVGEPFWGRASRTVARSGGNLSRRRGTDGRFTVGTAWERVSEIFQNEDAHHCIHSVARVGDLAPGETRTVRGRIVLVEGGPEKALAKLTFPR